MAVGGPRSSCVRPGAHSARHQDSHNDWTPYRMAEPFVSAGVTRRTPTKGSPLRRRQERSMRPRWATPESLDRGPASTITAVISHIFFPTYYSLLVVVSTIFFNYQTEVEEWMKKLRKDARESNRWHAASAVCLIIGLTATLLYAFPHRG